MTGPAKLVRRPCKRCNGTYSRLLTSRVEYCASCRAHVIAEKAAKRREGNRETIWTGSEPWHGTSNGYTNYICRCQHCSAAEKAYRDEWRKRPAVAERILARARVRSKTPERRLAARAAQYGIDRETLAAHLDVGTCFACGTEDRLHIDHDHECCTTSRKVCGECVRGLLCRNCNQVLGLVSDSREHLRHLIDYLDRWESRRASQ